MNLDNLQEKSKNDLNEENSYSLLQKKEDLAKANLKKLHKIIIWIIIASLILSIIIQFPPIRPILDDFIGRLFFGSGF